MQSHEEEKSVSSGEPAAPRLEMKNVSKSFPGVQALSNVDLSILQGEIHGLVGENGAGKSTLIKILSGAYEADAGRVSIDGQPIEIEDPSDALQSGIVTIYQETNLSLKQTVAENIFMGRWPRCGVFVDDAALNRTSAELLEQLGLNFTPNMRVCDLSPGAKQLVEIAKALSINAKLIVLDEPTASLTDKERDALFAVMRTLADRGVSILFVSHRLTEILNMCDRVTVLRDGSLVSLSDVSEIDENQLVYDMVGREVEYQSKSVSYRVDREVMKVEDVSGHGFKNVSFRLFEGEVLGFFGLVGAGRTEVLRAVFGADPIIGGRVLIQGEDCRIRTPQRAVQAGLGLVPEDRKSQGLILGASVIQNVSVASLEHFSRAGFLSFDRETATATRFKESLGIRCPSVRTAVQFLSGGNQQKVVLAKWIVHEAPILLVDEPTRGIDVAGKKRSAQPVARSCSERGFVDRGVIRASRNPSADR